MKAALVFRWTFGAAVAALFLAGCLSSTSPSPTASDAGGASDSGGSAGGGDSSCTVNNLGTQECFDYSGFPSSMPVSDCATRKGTYSANTKCDLTSSTGGCKIVMQSGTLTTWFYGPTVSTAAVQATCTADGNATFVSP